MSSERDNQDLKAYADRLRGIAPQALAQAKEAGVKAGKIALHRLVVQQVLAHNLPQFRILHARRSSADRLRQSHMRIQKTFAQHPLSHHARSAKKQHVHRSQGYLEMCGASMWGFRGLPLRWALKKFTFQRESARPLQ